MKLWNTYIYGSSSISIKFFLRFLIPKGANGSGNSYDNVNSNGKKFFFEKFLLFTYNIECDKICTQKALWRSQIYRFLNACGTVSTLLPMRVWINFNLLVPTAALTIISTFFCTNKKIGTYPWTLLKYIKYAKY